MKLTLKQSILAITLLSAGATAMADDRYRRSGSGYEYREVSRYDEPEVLYDRYGNAVYANRAQRYAAPVEDRCHRAPVVVQEYRRAPVCEERSRTSIRFEPPFFSPLRFLFRR